MTHDGLTLQEAIRWTIRQRDNAHSRGFHDVAAFWQDELDNLRASVPAQPHKSVRAA